MGGGPRSRGIAGLILLLFRVLTDSRPLGELPMTCAFRVPPLRTTRVRSLNAVYGGPRSCHVSNPPRVSGLFGVPLTTVAQGR